MIDGKLLYPIGSIYMNIQDTNPSVFFGGTWERIAKGKTLVGVDEDDELFNKSLNTGGEKEHVLTIDEIPSHDHIFPSVINGQNPGEGAQIRYQSDRYQWGGSSTGVVSSTGHDKSHNNMPPFLTCYIFVRTA